MKKFFHYRYIKLIILIVGLVGLFGGIIVSASAIRTEAEAVDFIIDAQTVEEYGHFEDITSEATITGTILKPIDDLDTEKERPCIFVFHGMFINRFMQIQTAMYFAKAGMYVVMLDQSGQGESEGVYRLGPEIEALGKTVIDYFIDEGFEKYDMNVNLDKLGCNGHSYGGIASTYAGLNRASKIKAVAAIWSWSELPQTVADIMVGVGTKPKDLFKSEIYKFITSFTGFGDALYYNKDGEYSTNTEDILDNLEERNTKDRVSFSNRLPPNYLLVTAEGDELTSPGQQIELMASASWNATGGISFDDWEKEIDEEIDEDEVWSNLNHENSNYTGNFDDKTARKIYLPKDTEPFGHGMEGFQVGVFVKILKWFGEAFNWKVKDVVKELETTGIDTDNIDGIDGPIPAQAALKWGGWAFAFLGFLIAFPALISYLIRTLRFNNDEEEYQDFINSYDDVAEKRYEGLELKLIGIAIVIYIVAEFLSMVLPIGLGLNSKSIGIPYIITDALVLIMIGRYLIVIPAIILLLFMLTKKINRTLNWEKMGIDTKPKEIASDILLGLIIAFLFLVVFTMIALITVSPRLTPRKSPTLGYMGYILLACYFLVFFFFDELSFRGIIQTKLHDFLYTKLNRRPNWLKKWLEFTIACTFQIAIIIGGTFLGLILILGGIPPVLVAGFLLAGMLTSLIPAFMSTYIYQRTKRIIPCVISSALILTFILGGSMIGAVMY